MTNRIDAIGVAVSVALVLLVLELVRRRRLNEEYSFVWVVGAVAVLVLSLRRDLLDRTARWLGVYYPPSLLLLVLLVVVFVGSLSISVVLSRHRRQIERLIEDSAILAAELRELREKSVPNPSGDAIARMSGPPRGSAVEPRGPGGQRRPH